jgi:hypothetical protein
MTSPIDPLPCLHLPLSLVASLKRTRCDKLADIRRKESEMRRLLVGYTVFWLTIW